MSEHEHSDYDEMDDCKAMAGPNTDWGCLYAIAGMLLFALVLLAVVIAHMYNTVNTPNDVSKNKTPGAGYTKIDYGKAVNRIGDTINIDEYADRR